MRRLLLLLLLGAGSGAALRSYHQQKQLHQELAYLTRVLTVENDLAHHTAQNTLKSLAEAAAKNQNQPADLARLRCARALHAGASQLVAALRTSGDQLRRAATGNQESGPLQHLRTPIGAVLAPPAPPRQALERLLAAYAQLLWQADPAATADPLRLPALEQATPLADALADLSQLESEVLARQTHALQRLGQVIGARRWPSHPLATATAVSQVVAPGGSYRAQLGVVSYFSAKELAMRMSCNGQPVRISPQGVGLVSFRAPTRPGPATWMGTIRLHSHGRDTTFKVRVPYRVARH
jgi:hypothetical protein